MEDDFKIIMHLDTFERLKNYKTLSDADRDEIVAYIGACEEEIHRLKGYILNLEAKK